MSDIGRDDVLRFLGEAFRNTDMPRLSPDDLADIAGGLRSFVTARAAIEATTVKGDGLVERIASLLKRQRANRYADEAIASSDLIDQEDAREIIAAISQGAKNVR